MKTPALHIYLVEAENFARQVVAQWLRDRGHRVSLLTRPEALLAALAADPDPTDLIVADLPPSQADTLGQTLRQVHRRYPLIPVVLRASSVFLPAAEALHGGVYGYLNKPFRPAELELMLLRLAERQAGHCLQESGSGLYHRVGLAHFDPARPCAFEELVAQADAGCRPDPAEQHRQTDKKTTTHSDV